MKKNSKSRKYKRMKLRKSGRKRRGKWKGKIKKGGKKTYFIIHMNI
jgi:hypothetical protein